MPVLAAIAAALTFASTRPLLARPYVSWDVAGAAAHDSLWTSGAVAVGFLCLVVSSVMPGGASVWAGRPRAGTRQVAALLAPSIAWFALGHLLGLAPLLTRSAASASWGSLTLADALLAVAGWVLYPTLGVGLGVIIGHWLAAPVGIAATYAIGLAPTTGPGRPVAALQPIQQWPPSPQFALRGSVVVFTLCAVLIVTLTVVLWASVRAAHGTRADLRRPALLSTACAAGLVVTAFAWRPDFYRPITDVTAVCTDPASSTICVNPANTGSVGSLRATADRLTAAGGPPLPPLSDTALFPQQRLSGAVPVRIDFPPADPRALVQGIEESIANQVTTAVVVAPCSGLKDGAWSQATAVQQAWLARAGFDALARRLAANGATDDAVRAQLASLSPTEFRSFFTGERLAALEGCRAMDR